MSKDTEQTDFDTAFAALEKTAKDCAYQLLRASKHPSLGQPACPPGQLKPADLSGQAIDLSAFLALGMVMEVLANELKFCPACAAKAVAKKMEEFYHKEEEDEGESEKGSQHPHLH